MQCRALLLLWHWSCPAPPRTLAGPDSLYRSAVPDTNLSKKADYKILASSTRRAGDPLKAAISHFNLGVVADNAQKHSKAIACYKKFIAAVRAAAEADAAHDGSGSLSARLGATSGSVPPPLWSSRTSKSEAGAGDATLAEASVATTASLRAGMSAPQRQAEALGFNALAISTAAAGDLEGALIFHAEHAKAAPTPQGRVIALVNAGMVHRALRNLDDSDACFQAALKLALAEGDDAGEMLAAGHIGLNATCVVPSPSPAPVQQGGAFAGRRRRLVRGSAPQASMSSTPPASAAGGGAAPGPQSPSRPAQPVHSPAAPVQGTARCLTMGPLPLERAKDALTTLLQLHAKGDDPRNVGRGHSALGTIAFAGGRLGDAAAHFHEASRAAAGCRDMPQARLDRCQLGMAVAAQQLQAYFAAVGEGAVAAAAAARPAGAPVPATLASQPAP